MEKTYFPFKMMIICSYCGNHIYAGASQGHLDRYLYYRCGNKLCTRKKKAIRALVILDFIYDFLREGLNFTEADYYKYYDNLMQIT